MGLAGSVDPFVKAKWLSWSPVYFRVVFRFFVPLFASAGGGPPFPGGGLVARLPDCQCVKLPDCLLLAHLGDPDFKSAEVLGPSKPSAARWGAGVSGIVPPHSPTVSCPPPHGFLARLACVCTLIGQVGRHSCPCCHSPSIPPLSPSLENNPVLF